MADASRDANRIPTLIGVDSSDTTVPALVAVDTATNRMLVNALSSVTAIIPGTGATNLGKAIGNAVGATDTGVLALGVHDAETSKIAEDEEEYTHMHIDELGALEVTPEQHNHMDEMDATTGWAVLNDDTDNLLTTNNHLAGSKALTFDKIGTGNSVLSGIEKTITTLDMGELDLHDILQVACFVSSITNIDYIFVRVGTSSSNYNEWRVDADQVSENEWSILGLPLGAAKKAAAAGTGVDWGAISYILVGVAFDSVGNTLSGIIFDQIGLFTNAHTTAAFSAEVTSTVTSPNVTIKKWGAKNVTNAAVLADNSSLPTNPILGAAGMWFDGSNLDLARGDATNGLLVNLGANNDVIQSTASNLNMTEASAAAIKTATEKLDDITGAIKGPSEPTIDSVTQFAINLNAGANQVLVSSAANKQIWVYAVAYTVSIDGTVSFQDEDDVAITGIMDHAANSGMAVGPSGNFSMPLWKLATDKDLEVDVVSAALDGWITYAIVSV